MKLSKIFFGIMALAMGATVLTACSDDDYSANTTPLLTDGSVVTGSSDVTATTATFHGTVAGLDNVNPASFSTGFYYGYSQSALTETASAASASEFSASLDGLKTGITIYYQAFVTLQGKLTYKGEVKSLLTTDAKAITGDATNVDFAQATLAGSASNYTANSTMGIVIAAQGGDEAVRAGLRMEVPQAASFNVTKTGLLPATKYYYAAYLDLGSGVVYGDVKEFTTAANDINVDDEFVDLGLSVKWAKRNVGAKTETDFGGLFGFGDVTGINPSIDPADYASADTYKTGSDIANIALGGKATLPTADLFEELFRLCNTEWTEVNGIAGYKVTGPNGNSIFLPAAGKRIAHKASEEGTHGYYLTGSVNGSNSQFAIDYEFTVSTGVRSTRAVYEAMAARPVSTARNIPLNKQLLLNTWHIDLRADGSHAHFDGPMYFAGTDDSWRTVTNGEPIVGNSWSWNADYAGNSWVVGEDPRDFGTMTFTEDGKVTIVRNAADGTSTTEEGTYTINESNKTITLSIDLLGLPSQISQASNKRTDLKIFSLTDETMQIAVIRDNDPCSLVFNYAADKVYSGIAVNLLAVGSDWGGTWGSTLDMLMPENLEGSHTVKYEGAVNGAMVTLIDFVGLRKRFPNAFARIDEIKLDGRSIKFNANNFCYGDIEDNGNFRIEMFNIWGKGASNGKVIASPFSDLKDVENDPAFTFAESCEITFTIKLQGPEATYTPSLITINPSWGGTWGTPASSSFDVVLNKETGKYEITRSDFSIHYDANGTDHSAGSIMTFVQIDNLYGFFPTMHSELIGIKLDGVAKEFDKAEVPDSNEDPSYRLELWNCYGKTGGAKSCAFGTPDGDVIHELGFTSTMDVDFNIKNLFAVPEF